MKTEQEIVLQKKMIIIFSLVILLFTMGILNINKDTVLAASKDEKITKVYTNYIANEELFKIDVSGEINEANLTLQEISGEEVNKGETLDNVEQQITNDNKEDENSSGAEKIEIRSGEQCSPYEEQNVEVNEAQNVEERTEVASRGSYIRETNVPPTDYERVISVKATAYCLCRKCTGKTPSSPGYGHTASGFVITPGEDMKVISVDPNVIPLGTEVYVEGYGYAIAADTGGAIKGNKIDVYKDTHELALQWGVRYVNVYVLKDE